MKYNYKIGKKVGVIRFDVNKNKSYVDYGEILARRFDDSEWINGKLLFKAKYAVGFKDGRIEEYEREQLWTKLPKEKNKTKKSKYILWLKERTFHILASIILGVLIAGVVHMVLENNRVRSRAEGLCTLFSQTHESICRNSVNSILDMADEDFENYLQAKGKK